MAESPLDDIDGLGQEIDRLWAKVASCSTQEVAPAPAALADVSPSQRLAWETVAILKRQHRDETQTWEELLSSKEEVLRALQQRVARLQAEKEGLTKSLRAAERYLVEQALEVKGQLKEGLGQEAQRAQQEQEALWQAERRQWQEKERQFVVDLRELGALSARHQEELARSAMQTRRLADGLNQVKSALEKTLAELLCERHDRETSEQERERALQKLAETEQHLQELSKLWDEERAQWGQLWDRERAGRKTAPPSEPPSEPSSAQPPVPAPPPEGPDRAAPSLRFWVALAALTTVLTAGVLVGRHFSRQRFQPLATQAVAIAAPTALAFDGTLLWLSSWDGRLLAYDPRNLEASVRSASLAELSPYHPSALVFGKESLWTLDATQSRLIRHKAADPSKIIASRPSPGPAPTAVAFDGQALWSYDAAHRALYRHGVDGGSPQPFTLNAEPAVTAMAWAGDHLWVFDAKTQRLVDYHFKDGAFRLIARTPFNQPVLSFAFASGLVDGRSHPQLWMLVGPDASHQAFRVVKYAY